MSSPDEQREVSQSKESTTAKPTVAVHLRISGAATGQAKVWNSLLSSSLPHLTAEIKTACPQPGKWQQAGSAVSKLATWKLHHLHWPPPQEQSNTSPLYVTEYPPKRSRLCSFMPTHFCHTSIFSTESWFSLPPPYPKSQLTCKSRLACSTPSLALNQGLQLIKPHNHFHPTRASYILPEAAEVRESATLPPPPLSQLQIKIPASLIVLQPWFRCLIHQKSCPEIQMIQ